MHDDVGAKIDWPLKVGRHERVVDDDAALARMRNIGNGSNVRNGHQRIRWRFDEHHPRVWPHGALDIAEIRRVHVRELHAVVLHDFVEQPECSAIDVFAADRVVALFEEKVRDGRRRGHSGREGIPGHSALEDGHVSFERHARRVLRARILEAFVFADALLDIGRCLIDGDGYRTCCRIRFLTRVNSVCFKTHIKKKATKRHKKHKKIMCLLCLFVADPPMFR